MATSIRPRRFDRVESEIVWAAIETLDPGLQYEILRELATIFAAASTQPAKNRDKVRRAVFALHDAADVLGHAPSLREYRRLRTTCPSLNCRRIPTFASGLAAAGTTASLAQVLTLSPMATSPATRSASQIGSTTKMSWPQYAIALATWATRPHPRSTFHGRALRK